MQYLSKQCTSGIFFYPLLRHQAEDEKAKFSQVYYTNFEVPGFQENHGLKCLI